ncbi:MAG: hypothetical protein O3B13_02525 [Planctomycetota bacterium]|nr:hypothetical protein [Planctomycetota bacterium]
MHLDPHPNLTSSVIYGLGFLYLVQVVMNLFWTARCMKAGNHQRLPSVLGGGDVPVAMWWGMYTALLSMVMIAHFTGYRNPEAFSLLLPDWFKGSVDVCVNDPKLFFLISTLIFAGIILLRKTLATDTAGWMLFNAATLFLSLSLTDWDFRQIVGKPDNVPIVGMLFIVGFFTWLFFKKANENDRRIEQGLRPLEAENNEKVLVWPDLVYTELIVMIALTAFLFVWGVLLEAPLEEPASSVKTPNPSKAPWYFLGLQEMLVYYDPWLAGVVFPSTILGGLMALPYIDFNKKGNGYYTFNERKFAISVFLFGFLPLWVGMIVLGTFLRGPNWNMFGIYEYWDVHKLEALNNVNLSEYFWLYGLGMSMPVPDATSSFGAQIATIVWRELPGILVTLGYLLLLPSVMAMTVFRNFAFRMGFFRFMVFANLVLLMAALPAKMVLRWAFNLKYLVAIPEYFINI